MMINPNGADVHIQKVMFIMTGRYQDMARRSFESNVTNTSLNALGEVTKGGTVLPLMGISTVANELVMTSAQADTMVNVPNGWNEPRLRFMIELVQNYGMNGCNRYIYTGWTDYPGASQSGAIDPNMRLHFNGVTALHDRQVIRNGMRVMETVPMSANQFLTPTVETQGAYTNQMEHLIRPVDIFTNNSVAASIAEMGGAAMGLEVHNYGATMANGVASSSRANNLSSMYIRNALKSYKTALSSTEVGDEIDPMELHQNASTAALESQIGQDPLVRIFGQMTNIGIDMELPWGTLLHQFPEIDMNDVTQIVFPGQMTNQGSQMLDGANSQHWHNQDMETVIASTLTQSVPALMTECLLGKISFMMSNEKYSMFDHGLVRVVQPELTMGLVNLPNMEVQVTKFLDLLESTVFPILSNNNQIPLSINVYSVLYGDTVISVSFNGNPAVDFVFPTFADALSSHMIAINRSAFNNICQDMTYIMENVTRYQPEIQTPYVTPVGAPTYY